jgi:hypothetical protein
LSKRFSGTNHLKTTPAPTELSTLEQELGDSTGFAERIQIIEKRLIRLTGCHRRPDPVALAANALFASNRTDGSRRWRPIPGCQRRQLETRFLAQVGVPPKLYAESSGSMPRWITSSDAAAVPGAVSPARFLARLDGLPEFHTLFAAQNRPRHA